MTTAHERVAREDLLTFISACFACTGQREFYADSRGQGVSIKFLHDYVLGNYRALYARVLACGINDFNQAEILFRLLATGGRVAPADRALEGALIFRALDRLPTQRAMRLLSRLAAARVNNRRTRAIIRRFLTTMRDREFRAIKYRHHFRAAAAHAHVPFDGELAQLFVKGWRERVYHTPLFESFRRAHFAASSIYDLPYSIAEGLARKHAVPRDVFLARIAPRMTNLEKLRLQDATRAALGAAVDFDPARLSPTRLASYIVSLPGADRLARRAELAAALDASAARAVRRTGARLGKVACVLDRSWSASGSSEKRRRPLAVALATSAFLRAAAAEHRAFWTFPTADELLVDAVGHTDLVTPLLAAMAWQPDTIVIVSDGFDNDPPGTAGELLAAARAARLCPFTVHVNPVFDDISLGPKPLGPAVPTMGLRDAEDLPTAIAFGELAHGGGSLAQLEAVLAARVAQFLGAQD
ncbi:MAG TPA: hypothetical protein VFP84_09055, partial [Kofleriaceae bacterium]|nr:hypothetical protein [Kofleriaceae bacterium]